MKKRVILFLIIVFLCSGCALDHYKNEKDAVKAVNEWFSFKNEQDDLGKTRRKLEGIHEIKDVKCDFVEKDNYLRYVYNCEISYIPDGVAFIPLAKEAKINVYTVLSYNKGRTYNYVVYNSKSEKGIWKQDDLLNYGKSR